MHMVKRFFKVLKNNIECTFCEFKDCPMKYCANHSIPDALYEKVCKKVYEEKINRTIDEFLEMQKIDKSYLFRLIDKIEIDKNKNVFISFNFAPLNTIIENVDEFINIEEIFNNDELINS